MICMLLSVLAANIPDWWIWAYWLSPITYTQLALSINELSHPRWQEVRVVAPTVLFIGKDYCCGRCQRRCQLSKVLSVPTETTITTTKVKLF